MDKLTKIHFTFENCNYVEIPSKYIKTILIDGVYEYYFCDIGGNLLSLKGSKHVRIMLDNAAMSCRTQWDGIGETFLSHLETFKDITHIHIFGDSGTDEYITVPFPSDWEHVDKPNPFMNVSWEDEYFIIEIKR